MPAFHEMVISSIIVLKTKEIAYSCFLSLYNLFLERAAGAQRTPVAIERSFQL